MTKLKVGDQAPDWEAQDSHGKTVGLKQFEGKILVFYFYPKDGSSVCTAQACELRDKYEQFIKAGAEVVGVSSDDAESHLEFTSKYKLPFTLLTDEKGKLAKTYGVGKELLFLPGRTTFIIDKHQKIAHIYSSLLNASKHVSESLEMIEKLKNEN
ncbi:AhpC/TSA family protein [Tieghemostelium lacteum]|uniref:thioredoxin-dependent peroxiredoxin n=1 Tax=Tieghemostelium lacteum TaxID=361077 RepID=A0A151ZFF8_TIELA|nr:AhpC/TSA family protein [Tieghemostelium lacteum]|eukprot:KYQ92712.1 AhpC/TSA family protein [Tieghemostelium lacteum]